MANDASIRVVDLGSANVQPASRRPQTPDLGPPVTGEIRPSATPAGRLPTDPGRRRPERSALRPVNAQSSDRRRCDARPALALPRRRRRSSASLLAVFAGMTVPGRAMQPIAALTGTARDIARTRILAADPRARERRRGRRAGPHPGRDAPRARRRADRDGDDDQAPARVRRRRLARAAHAADQHPRQPRAARGGARGEATDEDDRRDHGSALRSSRRMSRLVGDLLILARADAGRAASRAPLRLRRSPARRFEEVQPGGRRTHARARDRPRRQPTATPTNCTGWSSTCSRTPSATRPRGQVRSTAPCSATAARSISRSATTGPGLPEGHGRRRSSGASCAAPGPADRHAQGARAPDAAWRSSRPSPTATAAGRRRRRRAPRGALRRHSAAG